MSDKAKPKPKPTRRNEAAIKKIEKRIASLEEEISRLENIQDEPSVRSIIACSNNDSLPPKDHAFYIRISDGVWIPVESSFGRRSLDWADIIETYKSIYLCTWEKLKETP